MPVVVASLACFLITLTVLLWWRPASRRPTPFPSPTYALHLLALAGVAALVWFKLLAVLAIIALVVLLARAVRGLSASGATVTAKQVGFREIGYGALTVAAVAADYLLGW